MAKGSLKVHLQRLAREILVACRSNFIQLTVQWKSREEEMMVAVDLGLRGPWLLLEDFTLDAATFSFIFNLYNFTIDAMASYKTHCCVRYFSASYELEAIGTDFFSQRLSGDEFYWVS